MSSFDRTSGQSWIHLNFNSFCLQWFLACENDFSTTHFKMIFLYWFAWQTNNLWVLCHTISNGFGENERFGLDLKVFYYFFFSFYSNHCSINDIIHWILFSKIYWIMKWCYWCKEFQVFDEKYPIEITFESQ